MDWCKDEHEMIYPDNREEWNRHGHIQLCKDCNLTGRVRAMEAVVSALTAAKERLDYDIANGCENQYMLVPALEWKNALAALAKYKEA